jgi:DNA-binding response OmpR family regulator
VKILVVEDEKRIADSIKKGLELKSCVVDVAYDGLRGYDLASFETYDVIILDRMLPQMDGLEICRRLRAEKNQTPIIMLTAKAELEDRVDGLNDGADDYLAKPFAFAELLARLHALTRRPAQLGKNILIIDTLTIDSLNFQVSRAGEPIILSKKEFALLEFFVKNQGKVFSKEQLTQHVWNFDSDVLPNTAQVYVGYLRTKIDVHFPQEKPLFQTVRGFGYKFGAT